MSADTDADASGSGVEEVVTGDASGVLTTTGRQ